MKNLSLIMLCIATLGLASCKKDTIINQTVIGKTYNFTIEPNSWIPNADRSQYSFTWSNRIIDQVTLDDEAVVVYISHPDNPDVDLAIPATYNVYAYSYRIFNGGLRLDLQTSDNQDITVTPPTQRVFVKVVVIPSEYAGN